MKYDVVVVGAGSAGCMAAYTSAKKGFKVCLIDAKSKEKVGDKICGNALGFHHLDRIDLKIPNEVITNKINGVIIYSPSLYFWDVPLGDYVGGMLDRVAFGQYLLDLAISAGAELKEKTIVDEAIVKEDFVKGVKTRFGEEIYAEIVIDASGLKSLIRRKLPASLGIETVEEKDVNLAYREIRKVRHELEKCEMYLDPDKFPGGYAWLFPQSDDSVNVGLGVQKVEGFPDPKVRLYETVLKKDMFKGSEVLEVNGIKQAGRMDVPTRRPLASLVRNGIIFAGEAGSVVNPITGGGNGPAIVTGKFAGDTACEALEEGDTSEGALWSYNLRHYTERDGFGLRYSRLDAFRFLLQSVTPKDLDYAMKRRIIKEDDLITLSTKGELRLNIFDKTGRIIRGLGRPKLLDNLNYIKNVMEEIKTHCLNYPSSPYGFNEWKGRTDSIFSNLEKIFKPYAGK
ncbi:MAG: NAD(P)/FAD-dependent oxidoreductase [Candidatus Aenigmarchaeota archaeon]|nr:NAD(P)/FAD-dependent oxidoreductase [Candidatus Aenigmarchaeota archaeon]